MPPTHTQHLCSGWWEDRGLRRDRAFWVAQGGKTIPKGEKTSSLRFVLSVTEVTAYFSFFLKKKKVSGDLVEEEGRQAKHSTNYSGWRKPSTSCKGTNQNNRPLLKRPENALAPLLAPLSTSPQHHPQVYV